MTLADDDNNSMLSEGDSKAFWGSDGHNLDAQVGRGVWQGGAGLLWSVGGGVTPLVYVIMLATVREVDLLQNG